MNTSNNPELERTKQKVLYILKTHITIAEGSDPDEVYASMIARHIHENFILKRPPLPESIKNTGENHGELE